MAFNPQSTTRIQGSGHYPLQQAGEYVIISGAQLCIPL